MPTARQLREQRKHVRAELERSARARDRAELRRLRTNIKHARKLSKLREHEIGQACRQARAIVKSRRAELRARHAAERAATREAARLASRSVCDRAKDQARAQGRDSVQRALGRLAAERKHQRDLRLFAKPQAAILKQPKGAKGKKRSADAIQESDSEVLSNIPEDLAPVWRQVKGKIKGTARRSRTEAFLEWAAEHRSTVRRILDEQIEQDVSELIEREAELRERVRSPRRYQKMSAAELEAVPF